MKLAILGSRGYPSTYSGFETLVRKLAPYLVEQGHDVTVYTRRTGGLTLRWRTEVIDGVKCVTTPGWDSKTASTLSFGFTSSLHAAVRKFDAVLVLNVANGFYLPLIKLRGTRVPVNVDGIEWERDKWSGLGKKIFRAGAGMTARFADEIICDANAIVDYWKTTFDRDGVFIPYGGDIVTDRPTHRIEELGLTSHGYGLAVARLVPENNIDMLLDAIEELPASVPFVIVGSANYDSPIEQRIEALVANRPSLKWLGHISDQELLTDLWFHSGAYVHGHSVGGTNPSLLQALGAGAVVAAFDTPYNREVIGYASKGQFFGDPSELADLVTKLLSFGEQRTLLAAKSRERIAGKYAWADVLHAYEKAMTP